MADGHSDLLSEFIPTIASWFKDGASTIFYLTPFRVFEFCIGASVATIREWRPSKGWMLDIAMAIGLAMISYAIFSYHDKMVFPSFNALVPCIGAAIVILSAKAPRVGSIVRNKIAVSLGLISYSVYLIHWPLLVFYKYYRIHPIGLPERWALVVVSVVLGYCMYRWVERPLRHDKETSARLSESGYGLVCASLLIALVLPAATVWANGGWPWRSAGLPEDIALQIKDSKQFHIDQYGDAGFSEPQTWINGSENGVADIVVIGDSHASQLKAGFKELIGEAHGKRIFFSTASCLTLPGLTRFTPGTDWDSPCFAALNEALAVMDRSPNAILLIAEAWDFQVTQAAWVNGKIPLMKGVEIKKEAFEQLSSPLDELKRRVGDQRVVIVGGVPGAGVADAVGCFLRPKYLRYDCESILSTKHDSGPIVVGNVALKEYAESKLGVHFVDPFDIFCTDGVCRSFLNGKALYSDSRHLSKEGSRFFVGAFHKELLEQMN